MLVLRVCAIIVINCYNNKILFSLNQIFKSIFGQKLMAQEQKANESNPAGTGYMRGLAIDAVIFGFHDHQLKVLLMRYNKTGVVALPGGFIHKTENLNHAATRIVRERTGLKDIYLEQFYVFGDHGRSDPQPMKDILTANNIEHDDSHWLLQRFISI